MQGRNFRFYHKQQEPIRMKRITEQNRKEFQSFLNSNIPYTGEGDGAVAFGVCLYEVPCGAIELRIRDGYIDLYSIEVAEESRGMGIGSILLDRVKEFAAELDIRKIFAEFMLEDQVGEGIRSFLEANHFLLAETGSSVLTVRPAELIKTELYQKLAAAGPVKDTVRMNALPREVGSTLAQQEGHLIPEAFLPWNVKGRIVGELSPGIVAKNHLGAFVIVTELGGELCISGAYTDKANINNFVRLVSQMLMDVTVAYPEQEELYVLAEYPVLLNMFENLSGGNPLKKRTAQAMMWNSGQESDEKEELAAEAARETADGMEILVPKMMQLMDMLERQEIPCDLMMGEIPYLLVNDSLLIRYIPVKEDFSQFVLTFSATIFSEKTEEELKEDCQRLNGTGLYFVAVPEEGYIMLRYAIPEYNVPIAEDQFLACLQECMQELSMVTLT